MEITKNTTKKIEQIKKDIQLILQSKQITTSNNSVVVDGDEQHQLLLNLLSQLESLKEAELADHETKAASSNIAKETEIKNEDEPETSNSKPEVESEVIVKQLRNLEKQNRITHWLLSALIVVTLAWQVSEVSILLKLKEGLTHPFKSVGNMVSGLIKRPRPNEEEAEKSLLAKVNGSMDLSGLMNSEGQS